MASTHRVRQGECLVSIAESYGFFWETLWNHPNNQPIREARLDPTVLLPGDDVYIPDKVIKEYVRPTGARHTFKVKNVPAKFNLRLLDVAEKPRAGLAFTLTIDGVEHTGATDGDGWIRVSIPTGARRGELLLDGEEESYEIDLGHLNPVDTVAGAKERLQALRIYEGDIDDTVDPAFEQALRDFQRGESLEPTGALDPSTQSALRDAYGG